MEETGNRSHRVSRVREEARRSRAAREQNAHKVYLDFPQLPAFEQESPEKGRSNTRIREPHRRETSAPNADQKSDEGIRPATCKVPGPTRADLVLCGQAGGPDIQLP